MHLLKVTIENVRAIERLEIPLVAPDGAPMRRRILLGPNGCGKTTALRAIAATFGRFGAEFGAPSFKPSDVRQSSVPAPVVEITFGAVELHAALASEEVKQVRQLVPGAPADGVIRLQIGDEFGPTVFERAVQKLSSLADPFLDSAVHAIATAWNAPCVLIPANRGTLSGFEQVRVSDLARFDARETCLSVEPARFESVPSYLALAFMDPKRNDRDGLIARMWRVMAKFFPEMPKPEGVRGLSLEFKTRRGATVTLPDLSDGERSVLLILGEVALRAPTSGVVLIDEIEQHLHPRWQTAIVEALPALLPNAQFLIATQSPYTAASAPDDLFKIGDWDQHGE